ncbi:deSI-like protein At4g17486 [Musa acuminata AAA Group]|uniref:deSI-like protein At4g17486 n=1 Tax=Musa acuminata AAA Group TaxID=214697 RepID=UPI0031D090C8
MSNRVSMVSRSSLTKSVNNGGKDGSGRTHLYLNVYDLTPVNKYLYWFGLGVFHSGIEVHGMEYGFGAHEYPTSGVFEVEPKSCPGFIFRRSVWLGTTDMSRSEFRLFIEDLAGKYHGDTYHLIIKNCNHFTDEVCMRLTGKPIPGWVNRLARLGSFCNCILPGNIRVSTVGQLPTHPACSDDESDLFAWSSADESDEEDADCHPLKKPNIDFVHSIDEPLRLARDVM